MSARVRFEPSPARSSPRWNSPSSAASHRPARFSPCGTNTSRKRPIACAPPIGTSVTPAASRSTLRWSASASIATRSLVPSTRIAARALELKHRKVEELVRAFDRREGDREVLDGEAGRVEGRDLVVGAAALCVTGEHGPELGHAAPLELAGLDGVHEL